MPATYASYSSRRLGTSPSVMNLRVSGSSPGQGEGCATGPVAFSPRARNPVGAHERETGCPWTHTMRT
eukprot:3395896-Pyramimonas_sp.AAC.1